MGTGSTSNVLLINIDDFQSYHFYHVVQVLSQEDIRHFINSSIHATKYRNVRNCNELLIIPEMPILIYF